MDQKIPFTSYDFWAYLSAGVLLMLAVDEAVGYGLLGRPNWSVVQGVIALSCAYVVGQLVASMSALILENLLVGKVLGHPRLVLFGRPIAWKWARTLLPGYFKELPEQTRAAVLTKARQARIGPNEDEALLSLAYIVARTVPVAKGRLENFLNLYGFCRNAAMVAFIDAAVLYSSYRWFEGPTEHLTWSRIALIVGVGLTLRYLKFLRHFVSEAFTTFAYMTESQEKAGTS